MDANELDELATVAHEMLAAEGTGPAGASAIEEARAGYARLSMVVRADMLNGHGIAHGGMIFALADTRLRLCLQRRATSERRGAGLDRLPRQGRAKARR